MDGKAQQGRDDMARRWRSLAERRRAHLLALYRSGRWRKYYSEDQIMAQMRDLVREINAWRAVGREHGPTAQGEAPPLAGNRS
ncbi:MAG: TIGR03809 family protein [Variibacter sp.]|nr:TIGR03809 family protein [Variibacter sp.]